MSKQQEVYHYDNEFMINKLNSTLQNQTNLQQSLTKFQLDPQNQQQQLLSTFQDQLQEYKKQYELNTQLNDDVIKTLIQRDQKVKQLSEQVMQLQKEKTDQFYDLNQTIENLKVSLRNVTDQNEEKFRKIQLLESDIKTFIQEHNLMEEELFKQNHHVYQLEEQISNLHSGISSKEKFNAKHATINKEEQLAIKIQDLQMQLDDKRLELEMMSNGMKTLKDRNKQLMIKQNETFNLTNEQSKENSKNDPDFLIREIHREKIDRIQFDSYLLQQIDAEFYKDNQDAILEVKNKLQNDISVLEKMIQMLENQIQLSIKKLIENTNKQIPISKDVPVDTQIVELNKERYLYLRRVLYQIKPQLINEQDQQFIDIQQTSYTNVPLVQRQIQNYEKILFNIASQINNKAQTDKNTQKLIQQAQENAQIEKKSKDQQQQDKKEIKKQSFFGFI